MVRLLLAVLLCGVGGYAVSKAPMQDFFKVIAYCILAIIVIIMFFAVVFNVGVGIPIR